MSQQNSPGIINRILEDHTLLVTYLESTGQVSLQNTVESIFAKTLLLSAASYFEERIIEEVINVFQEATNGSDALTSFVRDQTGSRRYSSWFDWDRNNANKFFGAFGSEFRTFMDAKIKNDPELADSISDFMRLGRTRNALVHQNYAQFSLEMTVEQVLNLYQAAGKFVDSFPAAIREHINNQKFGRAS